MLSPPSLIFGPVRFEYREFFHTQLIRHLKRRGSQVAEDVANGLMALTQLSLS
jgi:hypothetical protein